MYGIPFRHDFILILYLSHVLTSDGLGFKDTCQSISIYQYL